ncbi:MULTISPECIES: hypothetical protein [Actinokineospora]|nr:MULTISPECIES: hypothetical protein [Actinokineospora]UVS78045.1 hypothetical protein Actkin_01769 [Actinokineospora sp. UTMC 2448]
MTVARFPAPGDRRGGDDPEPGEQASRAPDRSPTAGVCAVEPPC